jgi:hypothetical protein
MAMDDVAEDVFLIRGKVFQVFDEHAQNDRPVLVSRYGEQLADVLLQEAREQTELLIPHIPYIGGDDNSLTYHLVRATTTLALYRAMQGHGGTARETGRVIYEAVVNALAPLPFSPSGPPDATFIRDTKEQARKSQERRYRDDWVWEFVEGDGEAFDYGYDFYECAVKKYYEAQGATDLLPYFCFLDHVTAGAHGQVLMRTTTLAKGGEKCDFRLRSATDDDAWPPPFPGGL